MYTHDIVCDPLTMATAILDTLSPFDETKSHYYLRIKALNSEKSDISVAVTPDGVLTLALSKADKVAVNLPRGIEVYKISAELAHGVLTIVIPKMPVSATREIVVH